MAGPLQKSGQRCASSSSQFFCSPLKDIECFSLSLNSSLFFQGPLPQFELMSVLARRSFSRLQRSRSSNPYVALQFDLRSLKKMNKNLGIFEKMFHFVVK